MIRSLFVKLGLGFVAREIRNAAEGKHGPALQRAYLLAQGWKTALGFGLAVGAAALAGMGLEAGAAGVGTAGGLLISVGLLDKSWRSDRPWENARLYLLAREHSHDIAGAMYAATLWVSSCDPGTAETLARVGLTCSSAAVVLFVVATALVHLGLMAEAKLAMPPKKTAPVVAQKG